MGWAVGRQNTLQPSGTQRNQDGTCYNLRVACGTALFFSLLACAVCVCSCVCVHSSRNVVLIFTCSPFCQTILCALAFLCGVCVCVSACKTSRFQRLWKTRVRVSRSLLPVSLFDHLPMGQAVTQPKTTHVKSVLSCLGANHAADSQRNLCTY